MLKRDKPYRNLIADRFVNSGRVFLQVLVDIFADSDPGIRNVAKSKILSIAFNHATVKTFSLF